jgi:hypothetical protein
LTEQVLSDEDKFKAGLIEAALVGSGIMTTINQQINTALTEGKVTIEQSSSHRHYLTSQAASTMARGLEAAFNYLSTKGFSITSIEKEVTNGEDTSVATQGGAEPQGRTEREGQGVSQSSGLESKSSSEGSSIGSGGDETQRIIPSSNG